MNRKASMWNAWFVGLVAGLALVGGQLFAETPQDTTTGQQKMGQMGHKMAKKVFRIVDATFVSIVQNVKDNVLEQAVGGATKMDASGNRQIKQARQQVNDVATRMIKALSQAATQVRDKGVSSQFRMGQDSQQGMDRGKGMDQGSKQGSKQGTNGESGKLGTTGGQRGQQGMSGSMYSNYSVEQFQQEFVNLLSHAVQEIIPANTKLSSNEQKRLRRDVVRAHQSLLRQRITFARRAARSEIQLIQRAVRVFHNFNKKQKKAGAQ